MNTNKKRKKNIINSRISVRLWLTMMLLVIVSVAFFWIIQIFFLEKNFINSTSEGIQNKLQPTLDELKKNNDSVSREQLLSLSRAVNGKMIVLDKEGSVLLLYNGGHRLGEESINSIGEKVNYLKQSRDFSRLQKTGTAYHKVLRFGSEPIALEIGIPIVFEESEVSVVMYQILDQLHTVLQINRNQLIQLSILLSLIAALMAALLSLNFVRPIRILKTTVDRLAKGELHATPGLKLNDELGQLSNSMEELSQALQRVDVLRKEVIANVSHELRSPLALIAGYAEMVRDISWKDEGKRQEDLNLIIREAGRMSEMVSDILDYSQLQAGYIQLKKDWYNLYEIIESETDYCQSEAAEFNISVELISREKDIPVQVDAVKLCQIMRNLLNNALNHTKNNKTIIVKIENTEDGILVSVVNSGEPIPEEERKIIWEKYQRSQHQGRRNSGTGIGLSIVSTFLEAHGMPYGVDCTDGLTVFWFKYLKKDSSVKDK